VVPNPAATTVPAAGRFQAALNQARTGRTGQAVSALAVEYAGTAAAIALSFLITPTLLRLLSAPMYGFWIATAQTLLMLNLVDGGASVYLMLQLASGSAHDDAAMRRAIATTFWTYIALGLIVLVIGLALSMRIVTWLNVPAAQAVDAVICFRVALVAAVLFVALLPTSYGILQGHQRMAAVNAIAHAINIGALVLSLILALSGFGVVGMAIGQLTATAAGIAGAMYAAHRVCRSVSYSPSNFDCNELERTLRFTGFFQMSKLAFVLSAYSDSALISGTLGPAAVATYTLTQKLGASATMFINKIGPAVMPGLSAVIGTEAPERTRSVVVRLLHWLTRLSILGGAFALCLNYRFVAVWVGTPMFGGYVLSALFAYSVVRNGIIRNAASVLFSAGEVRTWGALSLAEAMAKVILTLALLPRIGLLAPILGTAIAELLTTIYAPWHLARLTGMTFAQLFRSGVAGAALRSLPTVLTVALSTLFVPASWGWVGLGLIAAGGVLVNVASFDSGHLGALAIGPRRLHGAE
jgi:O-antigen/teichoic acid export membrane protein